MQTPPLPPEVLRAVTRERLRLLSLAYFWSGAIGAIFVSFLIIHFTLFTVLSFIPQSKWNNNFQSSIANIPQAGNIEKQQRPHVEAPPVIIFRIAAALFGFIILIGWTMGGLTMYAGHCIKKRQGRTFVLIMGGVNCLWIPYGTLLGVATFVTLETPDAKEEYPG